jgi:uncharacterized protein YcbX
MRGHVAWIHVAPIKALAIEARREVELTTHGVPGDREFCIVDAETNKMLNAKRIPNFVTITPQFDPERRTLSLRMPDGGVVSGAIELGEPVDIMISSREVKARAVIGPWNDALTAVAERPLRLVCVNAAGEGADRAAMGGAATLLSAESLRALATAADADAPVDPRRFRMLFGVADVPAHAEDNWIGERVRIGSAVVVPRGNVGRCAVTSVDPTSGRADLDTLGALARYRGEKVATEPLPFGVWAQIIEPGRVTVGDEVSV